MPLLFSLGQHAALEAISRRLRPGERLFAFLDDIWFVTKPERVGDVHSLAECELWREAGIQVHTGKTHVWNRSGTKPQECDAMQRRAVVNNPDARVVWFRGSNTSAGHQSAWLSSWPRRFHRRRVAGSGCETPDFVAGDPGSAGPPVSVVAAPLRCRSCKLFRASAQA